MDLLEYAILVKPLLDEIEGQPASRLASLIVAGALALPADGKTFEVAVKSARKVLAEYAAKGRGVGPVSIQ